MINGLNLDFIPRAADLKGVRPQGEKETGDQLGFGSILGKESTPPVSKGEVKKSKGHSQEDVNAAQSSPLLQNLNQPTIADSKAAPDNLNKNVEFFPVSNPVTKSEAPNGMSAVIDPMAGQPTTGKTEEAKETTLQLLEMMRREQGTVRRQAMEEFLNSMENEFGIKPEKVLEAFARLDASSLMAAPEESAKEFVSNLDLAPAQEPRAVELYTKMLRTTGEAALNEKLIGLETGVNVDVVSRREQSLRELNQSIDELNSAFALRGRMTGVPMNEAERAQLAVERMDAQIAQLMREQRSKTEAKSDTKDKAFNLAGLAALGTAGAVGFSAQEPIAESMNVTRLNTELADLNSDGSAMNDAVVRFLNANESSSEQMMSEDNGGEFLGQNGEFKGAKKVGTKSAGTASASYADVESTFASVMPEVKTGSGAEVVSGPAGMMLGKPMPTAEDEQANVRELIRQAQIALKNGGGEIKMDLKPEGMGQVHLKVSLENGQVNVQMLTENDAAKRLLEKGLNELRADLTAQNLKVDTMKVDVGQELQNFLDQRNEEQAREQARQSMIDLMGQFRDERNAFRQSFMENSGWRQYRQGRGMNMNPEPVEATTASGYRPRSASSGRLDLVA